MGHHNKEQDSEKKLAIFMTTSENTENNCMLITLRQVMGDVMCVLS